MTVLAAPAVAGALDAAVFAVGSTATVAAGAAFSGDALVFALDAGPEGVSVDPATGLVTIPTGAALEGAVTVRATNAVGSATGATFAVTVLAAPATVTATVFDAPEKLAEVSLVPRRAAPSWTHDPAGWAVFSPGKPSDFTHGDWALARGDGRYRALVRINHSGAVLTAYTRSRPFGINGRMAQAGADLRGVRVELDRRVDGTTAFEIREYTGAGETATLIATAPVVWAYDVWYWMETEFDGPTVRARLYPEEDAAPAWQATATTAALGAGYFGPMSAVFNTTIFPVVQIRRLEHHPLAAAGPAPRLTGTAADVRAVVGETIRVDLGAVVEGAGLAWSAAVDGAAPPAGWAISPAGVLSAPTDAAFARRSVTVTATDELGRAVSVSFTVEVEPAAPRLTGALADVAATVGDVVRVDVGAIVAGTGLVFTVDRPWAIDAAGVLTVPTAALFDGAAAVTATDALARAVTASLRVTVRAPALVLTGAAPDVAATVGEARTVDVGALVTPKTGLTWTTDRAGWAVSAAGVLTIPTAAPLAAAAVSVTAADAFGQSVTATFQVSVAAAPLTLTTAPTLAAATPPGTALGSVWTIAGGVYRRRDGALRHRAAVPARRRPDRGLRRRDRLHDRRGGPGQDHHGAGAAHRQLGSAAGADGGRRRIRGDPGGDPADDGDHRAELHGRGGAGDGARFASGPSPAASSPAGRRPSSPSGGSCATARRSRPSARPPPTRSSRRTRARPSRRRCGAPTARFRRRR